MIKKLFISGILGCSLSAWAVSYVPVIAQNLTNSTSFDAPFLFVIAQVPNNTKECPDPSKLPGPTLNDDQSDLVHIMQNQPNETKVCLGYITNDLSTSVFTPHPIAIYNNDRVALVENRTAKGTYCFNAGGKLYCDVKKLSKK